MEAMRVNWTDDRLGERFDRIDERFDHVEERFKQVDERFRQVNQRFDQVDQRFDRVEADVREIRTEMKAGFEGLHRTLMQVGGGIIAALIGVIATQL
jgi:DNA anti-recombination protein RmuC